MEDSYVPVDPFLTPDGDLACLVQQLGVGNAQPAPKPAQLGLTTRFSAGEISLDLATHITAGGIFGGNVDVSERAFILEAMVSGEATAAADGKRQIVGTRYGAGLRILFRVSNVKTDVNLQFGMIGAAAQLGFAEVSYQVLQYGLDAAPTLLTVVGEFGKGGSLDVQTFASLQKNLKASISKQFLTDKDRLLESALPIAVLLSKPLITDQVLVAQSVLYAVRRIKQGASLAEALKQAGAYNATTITTAWTQMVGAVQPDDVPGDDARSRAANWLSVVK